MTRSPAKTLAIAALLLFGCSTDGPPRFELSGEVTYDGRPVPAGEIRFTPDPDRGNRGPGTLATIAEGRYVTRDGKGPIGGPHRIRIRGFDGRVPADPELAQAYPDGYPLFEEYETDVDLPRESGPVDFRIPPTKTR